MLTLLTLLTARAEETTVEAPVLVAAQLDALISVSVTPIIQHPLIEVEPLTDSLEFRSVLRQRQGQLIYCFETGLKHNPNLSGQLTVIVEVEAGVVQSVVATEDSFTDEDVAYCVTQKMRGWHYPESLSGEFTLPFTCGADTQAP